MRQGCLTFKHNYKDNESFVQISNKINICFPQSNLPLLFNPLFLCALYLINSLSSCSVKKKLDFSSISLATYRLILNVIICIYERCAVKAPWPGITFLVINHT